MKIMKHAAKSDKSAKKNKFLLILTIFNIALFLASGVMLFFTVKNLRSINSRESAPATSVSTKSAPAKKSSSNSKSKADKTSQTAKTERESRPAEFPQELINLIESRGITEADVAKTKTAQIVTVTATGNEASISLYELADNKWVKNEPLTCYGYVGADGVVEPGNMSEDVRRTPCGFYPIGEAFYQADAPETGLDSFKITDNTYWISDPDSPRYNQKVEGIEGVNVETDEHMSEISEYKYGFVINYNMPAEKGRGSAIFFHIGSAATEGCVAVTEDMVLAYLEALDEDANPYILIN